MDDFTRRAILSAIETEKASHDFYYLAASRATDLKSREFLMKLACEEYEHMSGFISIYPEEECEITPFPNEGYDGNAFVPQELLAKINRIDTWDQALTIAIMEEKSCIEQYSTLVDTIRMPEVHCLFKRALDESKQHLETIEAEYARYICAPNDSDTIGKN